MAGTSIRETARIDKPGACHIFRHSMATQMLDNGADTHIQAILGHEKLETTQILHEGGHKAAAEGSCADAPAEKRRKETARAAAGQHRAGRGHRIGGEPES